MLQVPPLRVIVRYWFERGRAMCLNKAPASRMRRSGPDRPRWRRGSDVSSAVYRLLGDQKKPGGFTRGGARDRLSVPYSPPPALAPFVLRRSARRIGGSSIRALPPPEAAARSHRGHRGRSANRNPALPAWASHAERPRHRAPLPVLSLLRFRPASSRPERQWPPRTRRHSRATSYSP